MARRRISPVFWLLLGGGILAYWYAKKASFPTTPRFVAIPPGTDRITAGDLYNRLPPAGQQYFAAIQRVAGETGIPPVLLAAIMRVESAYGTTLSPPGPAGTGDAGHGRGLMQVDDRSHPEFLRERMPDGTPKWKDAYENVLFAAKLLKGNYEFFRAAPNTPTISVERGSTAARKGVPVGTYADPRPLPEKDALVAAIAAYNAGTLNVLRAIAAGKPVDTVTVSSYRDDTLLPYVANVSANVSELMA